MQNIKCMGKDSANGDPQQRQLLLGNLLDKIKACPRSSLQTSLSVPFLLSMSHTSPPRVHQPLERRREGMMGTVREDMWNKCNEELPCSDAAWSHLQNLLLNCQVLLEVENYRSRGELSFQPWWGMGLIWLHHPEMKVGMVKVPPTLIGTFVFPSPKALQSDRDLADVVLSCAKICRVNKCCHLISGSCTASLGNWTVTSLWNHIGQLWKVGKRSSLHFNGHYQQNSCWIIHLEAMYEMSNTTHFFGVIEGKIS